MASVVLPGSEDIIQFENLSKKVKKKFEKVGGGRLVGSLLTSAGAGGQAFTFTEHDLDLGVLSGSYGGLKSPKKVGEKM